MWVKDRWFLVNRSILLSRGWSCPIIIEPTVVVQHQSTFNQAGVLQGWLVLERANCSAYAFKRRRSRRSRSWGTNNSTSADPWSLRSMYGGSKQLTSQHDWSSRLRRPAVSSAESRIGNTHFGSLRWRNTASILGTRRWRASGLWGYTKNTAIIWSSITFKCSLVKYWQVIIYLMRFLFSKSVCKGCSRFWLCFVLNSWADWKI